nr:hypothetical protein [Tanacetum cinerariifolium]
MSDMTALLNDLSHIPPKNEHNEPTKGDIGETSDEPTQDTRNEFEELYAKFFQNVFPISKGYKLPPSYYGIKKTFKMIGLGYESIHACEHDCCLFRGKENKDLDFCPMCNMSRWKDSNTPGKKVPKKVLHYFLIIPRLQHLYKSSHTAKEMIWHATGKCTEPDKMQHPVDGRAWKKFNTMYPDFAKEPRNVRLGLAADGFNHLATLSGQGYKACPTCNKDTPSVHVYNKTAYVGHKRFLKNPHKWRSSLEFNGQTDNRDPPKEFGQDEILAQLDRLPTRVKGKHPSYEGVKLKRNVHLSQTKNRKCLKPQAAYSFTPKNQKKFCQFIKRVKLPDGFGSCFKHKMTDNDTNITGLKSHDCHIMMQHLLPYGLQQYSPDKIVKSIIELCSSFKQICSATLMEDDMLKAQIKVVDILCDLELIYPPGLFDIMIHLVIHLPLEALEGGPIRPRWMFPFKRYMKKLKGYVRNKAKPEVSIAEGYVVEEALTFSSYYFRDVTTKFNHPDRNVDPPPPTYEFQVLRSIRQRHVDNEKDPEVSITSDLFALACGPTWTSISVNSCVVDGVSQGRKVKRLVLINNMTQIDCRGEAFKNDLYILVTQVKQVFYLEDKVKPHWKVVEHVHHKKFSNGGVIVVEDDLDIIHFNNSSNLPLSTSLSDLDNATLHIDGQSTEVDPPPDIIDVPNEDDDIIDDEDALPRDLADYDDEDLINVDDGGVNKVYSNVTRSYGGEDLPPPHHVPTSCEGYFTNRGKGKRKPNLGGRVAGRLHTCNKTRNLSLKEITDKKGPVPIRFEVRDKQTLMPLGDHAAHWFSYIGEVIRGVPLYYPSWLKVPKERKAALITDIGTQFDLRSRMESLDWTEIDAGIQQHLQKVQSPATQEYPSLIDTFFVAYTVNGVFTRDEDRLIYKETRRLEATGTYTDDEFNRLARRGNQRWHIFGAGRVFPARVTAGPSRPAPESTLKSLHKKVDFMMRLFKSDSKYSDAFSQFESAGASGSGESGGCGDDEESADDQEDEDKDGDGDS